MTSSVEAVTDLKPYPAYKDSGVPWLGQGARALGATATRSLRPSRNRTRWLDRKTCTRDSGIPCIRYG